MAKTGKTHYWLMKNILTNQFPVKVQIKLPGAAPVFYLPGPKVLCGQGGWAKYRDSENAKGLAVLNCGMKSPLSPSRNFSHARRASTGGPK
jgi:hypothetical protein